MPKKPTAEQVWQMVLQGKLPGLSRVRKIYRVLPAEERCKNCHAPLNGLGGKLMHLFGRHPYHKNPRFCNWCMWLCRQYPGGTEIELTLFFADVRGSTNLAEGLSACDFSSLMNRFYTVATDVLIQTDAFIDKLVGDEVMGLYLPGYAGKDHAKKAVMAAQGLLHAVGYGSAQGPWLPIGIGVHTGVAYVGTVQGARGTVTDFTALGDNVNIAARLVSQAKAGEAVISETTYVASGMLLGQAEQRHFELKGKSQPFKANVLRLAST